MQGKFNNFIEAIQLAHLKGLKENKFSYIIGLGVNYPNGADGSTAGLAKIFKNRVLDVPVSEAAFTGMSVGMGTMDLNPIVHHGRMEFALLAMDSILTQAAKWDFMFGGDYPCRFASRINIGRQWGNGPQHTSSYNSLFVNTPGLNVLWPSRPQDAHEFIYHAHFCKQPTIIMEHRYLFKTLDDLQGAYLKKDELRTHTFYGDDVKNIILTYGDGLVESLRVKEYLEDASIDVICINSFTGKRKVDNEVADRINRAKNLLVVETSNYQFGLMQGFIGALAEKINLTNKLKVFSPDFIPCATSPKLVADYYPFMPEIAKHLNEIGVTKITPPNYTFDQLNLPAEYNFNSQACTPIYQKIEY